MLNLLSTFYKDRIAIAIGAVFASVGIVFGTWAAFIPFIKNKFGLDEAELGMLLLMLPLGAGLMNPICVPMIRKMRTVNATIFSLIILALFLITPINMPFVWLAGIMLFLYGMAENSGYSANDTFYEANGSYSYLYTCNEWVNQALKTGGIRTSIRSPFDFGDLYQVRRQ